MNVVGLKVNQVYSILGLRKKEEINGQGVLKIHISSLLFLTFFFAFFVFNHFRLYG